MNPDIFADLIITKVHSVTTMYTEKNTKGKKNSRPCWAIVNKYEGETEYSSDGKIYVSNMNNIIILPKGCSYEWVCTAAGHFSIIEFECEKQYDKLLYFPATAGEKLLRTFKGLEYKRILRTSLCELECIKATYEIILQLAEPFSKNYYPESKKNKIRPALDYIAQNYTKRIKNDDLAEITSLSTVYFRKLFTEIFGMSPIAYIHFLRIQKATEMLKSDYGSITGIAQSLGYISVYDFSRTFRKYTGLSPTKYIKTEKAFKDSVRSENN